MSSPRHFGYGHAPPLPTVPSAAFIGEYGQAFPLPPPPPPSSFAKANFFYFIGRLNPPHSGHIAALAQMIAMANASGCAPLILLGNGPGGGARTLDDPITFEMKRGFLQSKLPGDYIMLEMENPAKQVCDYIRSGLSQIATPLSEIDIYQFAGNKGDDSNKLDFIKPCAMQSASETPAAVGAKITTGTVAIKAVVSDGLQMSATQVRKDAYSAFLSNADGMDGLSTFSAKYGDFYGPFTEAIYRAIISVIPDLDAGDVVPDLEYYIQHGKIMKKVKSRAKSSKKGVAATPKKAGGRRLSRKNARVTSSTRRRRFRNRRVSRRA